MNKPRSYQALSWTAHLAYAVGLLATDGNLSPDGRHLELVSKDRDQIECFKTLLNLTNQITQKSSSFSTERCYRIQFGSVALYRWLVEIGLMPNKSKALGKLIVPDEFFWDFLRGSLDGDGTFRVYQDPDYPASQRLYTTFHSASLPHLEWLQETTKQLLGLKGYISDGRVEWALNYAKAESRVLISKMYYHPDVPCLRRKRALIEQFL